MRNKYNGLKSVKLWGASTAAHQVEGNTNNQWSHWERRNAERLAQDSVGEYAHWLPVWKVVEKQATSPENYISGQALDHYHKYRDDFDLMKDIGLNAYRFSIEWSRIEPRKGEFNQCEIQHYIEYVDALRERGIEPVLTLWHWTMPLWFVDKGEFQKKENIRYFENYCNKVIKALQGRVKYICILNEPSVYALLGYQEGRWPPCRKSRWQKYVVMRNLYHAHKRVYRNLKELDSGLCIGTAYALADFQGDTWLGRLRARLAAYEANWWWLDRVAKHADFIGFNYYFSNTFHGLKRVDVPGRKSNYGWLMEPWKIERVATNAHKRYKKPLIITENGLADAKDQNRQWWLEQTMNGLDRAVDRGVEIHGYLHWSLLDNFEWSDGYWPQFGLVHVDRKSGARRIRKSARWYGDLIKGLEG